MPTPEIEECNCPVELKPMAEWIQEDDPNNCRPCLVAPVAQWYRDELSEQKQPALVRRIDEVILEQKAEPLQICEMLDTIKDEVEDSLRERLKDFDCAAQTFDPEDESDL